LTHLAKMGIVNRNSILYRQKCQQTCFFPFSISLVKGGRIELVATNIEVLETWIVGLNYLIGHKKQLRDYNKTIN